MISNTGGMGLLLQALYNTPINDRIKGVERSLDNMCEAISTIENNPEKYKVWQHFSEYALMQIFGSFFAVSHWSITLLEAFRKEFAHLFSMIDGDNKPDDQTKLEFEMFMLCTVLASEDFLSFEEFRLLVENSKSNSLNLFAVLNVHRRRLQKRLNDIAKTDENFIRASKKLVKRSMQLGDISSNVNIPLLKASKVSTRESPESNEAEIE
jgi:hypothetical protein